MSEAALEVLSKTNPFQSLLCGLISSFIPMQKIALESYVKAEKDILFFRTVANFTEEEAKNIIITTYKETLTPNRAIALYKYLITQGQISICDVMKLIECNPYRFRKLTRKKSLEFDDFMDVLRNISR